MGSIFFELIFRVGTPLVRETALDEGIADLTAKKAIFAISLFIILPLLVSLFFLLRSVYRNTIAKKLKTTVLEDYQKEAKAYEKAGEFVSAANVYEKHLNDNPKAAALYEKGGDYTRSAELYNFLGMTDKAKEMYSKAGDLEDAAEVALMEGELDEAAALYDKAGKKNDVAKVMKQAGKAMYAVKAYREAGEYRKAAMLLNEEGMPKEAAEMLGFYLYEKEPDSSTIEDFYTHALLLEKTGDTRKAIEVLAKIYKANPEFEDVKERLVSLRPAPEKEEEVPEGKTALRSFLRGGRIEPVYSLKLWVQVLKSLQTAIGNGWPVGLLSPDNIVIDARNNVSFLKRTQPPAYAPPEIIKGLELDERAEIYSAGVILFEMLTGGLEGLGSARVAAISENVPEWLDEIVIKCTKKVREDRYQSLQDIFADLKRLSKSKQD
jgi:tetratricopeptide (TPR) repeat protein